MMATAPVWHGTDEEAGDLLSAVSHNCACQYDDEGLQQTVCTAHEALAHDQVWLDRMLYARRMCARFASEEFTE